MMRPRLRKYLPVLPVVCALLFAGWALFRPRLPLTQYQLTQADRELRQTAATINHMTESNREALAKLSSLLEVRHTALTEAPAQAAVLFRERIEQAAAGAGLRSRTMGVVRRAELLPEVVIFEVNFSADGQTGELAAFLESLYRDQPRLYWKTLTIKPNSLSNPEYITLSGTLTALTFSGSTSEAAQTPQPETEGGA